MTTDRPTFAVSILTEQDRPAILAHLLGLSDADRRARFWRCMSDAAIEAHVATACFDGPIRLGARHGDDLVGLVEGFPYAAAGETRLEAAFSTDAAWRRQGIARKLGAAMNTVAAERGVRRVVASCEARNAPMRGVLRHLDAAIESDAGECVGSWRPTPGFSTVAGAMVPAGSTR